MPLITLAMSEVPTSDAGLASGLVNVSQQMSAALGIAVLGTLAASRTTNLLAGGDSSASALTGGYRLAFLIAAGCVAVGIVIAVTVLRGPEQVGEAVPDPGGEEIQIREGLLADELV
jgi:hypothetical protein